MTYYRVNDCTDTTPQFIADAFDVMSGRTVTLHAITPLRPMLLEEPGRFALIMPIRLND